MEQAPLSIEEMDKLVEDAARSEHHIVYTSHNQHRPLISMVWFPCRWKKIGWYSFGVLLCGLSWYAWAAQVTVWRFTFLLVQGGHEDRKEAEWKRNHTYRSVSIQQVAGGVENPKKEEGGVENGK